ncbi:MAG: hypothetical protein IPL78_33840 [Chloroflexi bacterium]|nr:hypothetical protein [Chloroflexota bacterium]
MKFRPSLAPWTHVRPLGEDMIASDSDLPANHRQRSVDLGALAGSVSGRQRLPAAAVAIIPTGSELISVEAVDR